MIEFRDVSYQFARGQIASPWVLRNFCLSIDRGEFHVILGVSGCGKTTALNLLAGFEQPTEGAILVDGRTVDGPGADRIVIFQGDDSLYPWLTALENVAFGLRVMGVPHRERRERALEYLRLVGLHGQGRKYPSELSGGMKQRIQIARALACHSSILLMDEPFAAVDAQTRANLQEELAEIWQKSGRTIFFITHDISEALILADRISVMTAGPDARIKETLEIDMRRPRSPGDSAFAGYYDHLRCTLAEEQVKMLGQESPGET